MAMENEGCSLAENEGCSRAENAKDTPVTLDNLVMGRIYGTRVYIEGLMSLES